MSTDLTGGSNPGANASKNIINIINAAAESQKAQTDLKKEIMLHQIQQKMDLQENAAKLQQGVESNINQKNANINWLESMGGDASTPAAQTDNGLGAGGTANSGTPAAQGSPMGQLVNPGAPQTQPQAPQPQPPMTMANPAQQPANDAAQQPIAQPQPQPPSQQYTNLGYQPIEAPQILAQRRAQGQSPNFADTAYVQALSKVKAGTASADELAMVNKMNNKDGTSSSPNNQQTPSTNLEVQPTPQMNKIQAGLRNMEKMQGLPDGSLWMNPSTGEPEINPIAKSKIEAQNKYNLEAPDRYGKQAEQDLMHVFSMRSGALGVQDAKINQSMHIKQLFDQAYDPKTGVYNLKAPQFAEATQGLAVLVSNSNQTSEGQRQEIKQRTLNGDFNGALTYAFGIPKNATSQEIADMYIKAVDRQGLTAQSIKEKDISDIKGLDSFNQLKKIAPERADNLYKANFGVDYRDFINKPWNERIKMVTGQDPNVSENGNNSGGGDDLKALLAEKARRAGGR